MSKKRAKPKGVSVPMESEDILDTIISMILGLPRLFRIIMIAIFGLAVTGASFPLIDNLYVTYFFNEQTILLPSLVSAGFGAFTYVVGWVFIVGTRGVDLPHRKIVFVYTLVGLVLVVFVLVLVVTGYSSATAVDS